MMATREELMTALRNAHDAGDTEGARRIAAMVPTVEQPTVAEKPKGSYLKQTLENVIPSATRFASGVADAVMHPIDTAGNVMDVAAGGLRNALPSAVSSFIDKAAAPEQLANIEQKAGAVGELYKQRYGGAQNIADTFREDPIGVLGDASAVLGGGGLALRAAPAASKAAALGRTMEALGTRIDPIAAAARGAGKVLTGAGNVAKNTFGTISNIPVASLEQAYRSGKSGEPTFVEHMRKETPTDVTVGMARENIQRMRNDMADAYRQNKDVWASGQEALDFTPVEQSLNNVVDKLQYKGNWKIGPEEQTTLGRLRGVVDDWKADPALHTAEGLDALKQRIQAIYPESPSHRKAQMAVTEVGNAVKNTIADQNPTYAAAMKDYWQRASQLDEIEKTLSLGSKGSVDTAIRKLQTVDGPKNMRRSELLGQMEEAGGVPLRPALAGQAMSEWVPKLRGLGGVGVGGLAALVTGNPAMLAVGALSSPRLVGEALHGAGKLVGSVPGQMVRKGTQMVPKVARAGTIAAPIDEQRVEQLLKILRERE